ERARDDGADLIVMSTHGRTGFSHILLGSVTEKVVRTAPCPVVSIHPKEEREGSERKGRSVSAALGLTPPRKVTVVADGTFPLAPWAATGSPNLSTRTLLIRKRRTASVLSRPPQCCSKSHRPRSPATRNSSDKCSKPA